MSTVVVPHTLALSFRRRDRLVRVAKRRSRGFGLPLGAACAALLAFTVCSLLLANLTLHLQKERVALHERSTAVSNEVNALNLALAERQSPQVLKVEAERLGLVGTTAVSFIQERGAHLTQQ